MKIRKNKEHLFTRRIDWHFMEVYSSYKFFIQFFKEAFHPPFEFREIIRQCYEIGVRSIPLITLTGFVIGIVFTKQSRPSLVDFGATSWLPSLTAIAFVRALAPLVTAIISAGKVGSNIGSELGAMRVTEQIDAMDVSAVNPFKFLVVTRVVASSLMIPILTIYCGFVGLMGAYLNVHFNEMTSFVNFFENAFSQISFLDIYSSLAKSVVFGFTIGIVSTYQGYFATNGTQGVGKASNSSVVISMFLIFFEEIIAVQITNWLR